jgi:hypothetical protein
MNADALVEQWPGNTRQNVAADEPLPDEIASVVVERLHGR